MASYGIYLGLWWLNTLVVFNPFIPVGVPLVALICATYLLFFAFPAGFVMRRLPAWLWPFPVAFLWVGMEFSRTGTDLAFPWNFLGHSQVAHLPLIQVADIAGVYAVSFLVILANAAVAAAVIAMRDRPAPRTRQVMLSAVPIAAFVFLLTAGCWYGASRLAALDAAPPARLLKVAIIQPKVSQMEKWLCYSPETTEEKRLATEVEILMRQFNMMTEAGAARPALYILPEAAVVSPFFVYDTKLHETLAQSARVLRGDVLLGADRREPVGSYARRAKALPGSRDRLPDFPSLLTVTNDRGATETVEPGVMAAFASAWFVTEKDGMTSEVYDKMQLVPFGEQAPIVGMIPGFQEYIMMAGSFQPGLDQVIFETSGTKFGVMICFESAFASLARGIAQKGGQFACVITNDAWYDPSYAVEAGGFSGFLMSLPVLRTLAAGGPDQHFVQSVFRAVETRLPVVRCANTGTSAVIDPTGRAHGTLPFGERGTIIHDLPIRSGGPLSFYASRGDWFARACLILIPMVMTAQFVARKRARRDSATSARA